MHTVKRTKALVRVPSPRLAEGEVTHIDRVPMDVTLALRQHRTYLTLLERLGLMLVYVPEASEHPDGLFVEDTLVMVDSVAVLTRPGAPSRAGEVVSVGSVLADLHLRVFEIAAPATVDGGDVLVTDRHVFVGQSTRSNQAAVGQFDRIVAPLKRKAIAVSVTGCLHLKSAVTALPDGSLIAVEGWVDPEVFRSLGYTVHLTDEPSGGDVLSVDKTVVLPADAPATARRILGLGFEVAPIDVSELQKIEAGVTCLSVLV